MTNAPGKTLPLVTPSGVIQCRRVTEWLDYLNEWLKPGNDDAVATWRDNRATFVRIKDRAERAGQHDALAICEALEKIAKEIGAE